MLGGGGVSHPSQLTTGLVIKSVTTSPTLAGERMLFILQVSILSEQTYLSIKLPVTIQVVSSDTSARVMVDVADSRTHRLRAVVTGQDDAAIIFPHEVIIFLFLLIHL